MAIRGRKPKPIKLKLVEGIKKRPIKRKEVKPKPIAPTCPEWLNEEAKKEWSRVSPILESLGLLTILDRAALEAYCVCYSRILEAEQKIKEIGLIVKDRRGSVKKNPYVTIASSYSKLMISLCGEFGMTPSSRGRMQLPIGPDDDNDMERLLDQ